MNEMRILFTPSKRARLSLKVLAEKTDITITQLQAGLNLLRLLPEETEQTERLQDYFFESLEGAWTFYINALECRTRRIILLQIKHDLRVEAF